MAEYLGHILLVIAGTGITCAGIMETRQALPIILCWIGQMIVAGSICHFVIDITAKVM